MPVSARQLVLLLAVAAAAFAAALALGNATQAPADALPAAPSTGKVSMSGAGRAVSIPALKVPRRAAPVRVSGGAPRPAQAQPRPSAPPAQPSADDVIVSG